MVVLGVDQYPPAELLRAANEPGGGLRRPEHPLVGQYSLKLAVPASMEAGTWISVSSSARDRVICSP